MNITKAELRKICEEVAETTIKRTFEHIGIEPENHADMRRDFEFLRDWRRICDMSKRRGAATVVTMIVGVTFTLIVAGITSWILGMR